MRSTLLLWITGLLLSACGGTGASDSAAETAAVVAAGADTGTEPHALERAALVEAAEAAVAALAQPLQAQLKAALEAGGPVMALEICSVVAPGLAEAVSVEHDLSIRRVSLKNRNPTEGEPSAWQRSVLETFEAEQAAGAPAEALIYSASADGEFRYMKAIPTGRPCLACHGEQIAPEVAATLAALYPEDRATGFKEGDIRGAFVVTKALKP